MDIFVGPSSFDPEEAVTVGTVCAYLLSDIDFSPAFCPG
jgi:hypothetical protein